MKKLVKALALFSAIAMIGTSFIACANDDDNDDGKKGNSGSVDAVVKLDGVEKASFAEAWEALGTSDDHVITLGKGTYTLETGKTFKYAGTGTITIQGDSTAAFGSEVVLSGNPNTSSQNSRELFVLSGNGTFVIKNLTMKNTYGEGTTGDKQAEVLASTGNGKIVAYNSTFLSHQDTIRTTGKSWFYKCAIKGDVDFLWMEKNGVVALYEDCELTALNDRTTAAYFIAPRTSRGAKIGKGLVVLNSKVIAQSGVDTYLFRNPWSSNASQGIYNNGAFVNVTVEGTLNAALAKSAAWGVGDDDSAVANCGTTTTNVNTVGWKVDSTLAANYASKLASIGVLSAEDKTNEYSNRGMILNRLISIDGSTTGYVTDEEDIWDVSSYNFGGIENNESTKTVNPKASDFDATNATVTWDFSGASFEGAVYDDNTDASTKGYNKQSGKMTGAVAKDTAGTYKVVMDINAATGKLAINLNTDGTPKGQSQFNTNTVLTVPVSNGAKVTVKPTSAGTNVGINNVLGTGASADVVYTADSIGEAIVFAKGDAYISKVIVENLDLTAFNTPELKKYLTAEATGSTKAVVVNGSSVMKSNKTADFNAVAFASYRAAAGTTVEWASSNTAAANFTDAATGTLTGAGEGNTNVTATIDGVTSAPFAVKVELGVDGAFSVEWLDKADHCKVDALDATNDDGTIAYGSKGTASTLAEGYGAWSDATSKVTAGKGGLMSETSNAHPVPAGYDTFYIDFPITAEVACTIKSITLGGVNWGTGNVKSKISYKRASDAAYTEYATDLVTRSVTALVKTEKDIALAAGETITIRVAAGAASEQQGTRTPGVPYILVEGVKN
ncbi:MAG: hypothetical protein KBT11_00850 [Treponema sp.]|nr:hypothetical protein [Candidatus Treponema equifaecale]